MITSSFHNSAPKITPEMIYGKRKHLCDDCVILFSHEIQKAILDRFPCEQIGCIRAANGATPIYAFPFEGKKIAFYLSAIGSALASTFLIEANVQTGATHFFMSGSAGNLNSEKTAGKYVIPTEAYRDEGMSYHYAPPSDYIRIKNADRLAEVFDKLGLPYVLGRNWTTDAFYRETEEEIAEHRAEGCLTVEMELAGVQAVCDYYGFELYDFLATGDVLDNPIYDLAELGNANHNLDKFYVTLELIKNL